MLRVAFFILALLTTNSWCQEFVYAYDAEPSTAPQSNLFNPNSFRYVPPSAIQRDAVYVGRASTAAARVTGSSAVPSRTRTSANRLPVATPNRAPATASEYLHPTRGDNEVAPAAPVYQPRPQPQPQPQYAPQPLIQDGPRYQLVSQDQYEVSRQQLYADQPTTRTNSYQPPFQYVHTYPQSQSAESFPVPFQNFERFRPTAPPNIPNTASRPVQHHTPVTYQPAPAYHPAQVYQPAPAYRPAYMGYHDGHSGGPAQNSFFGTVGHGHSFYIPPPPTQAHYQPAEPTYQYNYRPLPTQYEPPAREELQPEQPYQEYQPPQDNTIQEQPRPAPTRAPTNHRNRSRSRPRVSAYEPATVPQRQIPAPQKPQRRPSSPATEAPSRTTTFRPATIGVAQLPPDRDGDGIPGEGGVDYPNLSVVPRTSFSCARQQAQGYYADLETSCQVVHSCQAGGIQHSFLCPNGTVFNQEMFSCQWWYRVDCAKASQYYALNDELYKTTAAPRRRAQPPPRRTHEAPPQQAPRRRPPPPSRESQSPPRRPQEVPIQEIPVQEAPVQVAPVQEAPVQQAPRRRVPPPRRSQAAPPRRRVEAQELPRQQYHESPVVEPPRRGPGDQELAALQNQELKREPFVSEREKNERKRQMQREARYQREENRNSNRG